MFNKKAPVVCYSSDFDFFVY